MSVGRMLAEVDSAELSEWMAYDQIEPFGAWREDLRAAMIQATVAAAAGAKSAKPSDFMPNFEPRKPQPIEQQMEIARRISEAFLRAKR